MTAFTLSINGHKPITGNLGSQTSVNLYRVRTDYELYWIENRPYRDSVPAMWHFSPINVEFTQQWQYYLWAINYKMTPAEASTLMNDNKAFMNGTGINGTNPRANFLKDENITAALPYMNKCYVCSNQQVVMNGGIVATLDGTKPPLLKSGYSYPSSVSKINPAAYYYMPMTHPHLFTEAVIVYCDGKQETFGAFPNAESYPYHPAPVVWFPIVSDRSVVYPPADFVANSARLVKV